MSLEKSVLWQNLAYFQSKLFLSKFLKADHNKSFFHPQILILLKKKKQTLSLEYHFEH